MSRRYELDLCRITACIMVIIIHAGSALYHSCPLYEPAFVPLCFISTAVRGSVPVFFMLTGLLMLSREKLALGHFFRRHILRLAGLFLFWSVLYALGSRFSSGSFGNAYDFFFSVMAGHYHMWFIAAMVTCCLFIPILYAAIRGAKLDTRWLLGVFLFLVLLMQNCNLTPDPAYILNRFTLNFGFDYLPYLLYIIWGWYLGQREYGRRTLWLAPLVFLLTAVLTTVGNVWYSNYRGYADGWLFSYFSLPNFIMASAMFCFFLALKGHAFKHGKLIHRLSDCTLGVYLLHPLMLNILERFGVAVGLQHAVLSLLGVAALCAVLCFAVSYVAKKIPLVRNLL